MVRFALRYLGHRPGACLAYFTGASVTLVAGEQFDVPEHGLVLGRRASADLRVASASVAPAHVRVVPCPDGLRVVDLGSTNQTLVNDAPITSMVARPGDRLTLAYMFDFEVLAVDAGDRS